MILFLIIQVLWSSTIYREAIYVCVKWLELQVGIKRGRKCTLYHFNGRKSKELKRLLMKVKEESERVSLKLNIKKQTNKQTKHLTP